MKKTAKKSPKSPKNNEIKSEVPVLYQNLNGELYAFTELSGQIFWGKVSQKAKNPEDLQWISEEAELLESA